MDFVQTVLVTGGAGFIGSHFVCSLVNRHPDWRVINFDNLDYCSNLRNLESVEEKDNYTFIRDGAKNNYIVKNSVTTWKKMKQILQEPISLPMEQSLDSFSEFTDKLTHMEN